MRKNFYGATTHSAVQAISLDRDESRGPYWQLRTNAKTNNVAYNNPVKSSCISLTDFGRIAKRDFSALNVPNNKVTPGSPGYAFRFRIVQHYYMQGLQ